MQRRNTLYVVFLHFFYGKKEEETLHKVCILCVSPANQVAQGLEEI